MRDPEGSLQRKAEFDVVCINPTKKAKPEPPLAPAWCHWTQEANKVIRANNAIARD